MRKKNRMPLIFACSAKKKSEPVLNKITNEQGGLLLGFGRISKKGIAIKLRQIYQIYEL